MKKNKVSINSTLGFIGNASLIFSVLSSLARIENFNDLLQSINLFGDELILILTKIIQPWRFLTSNILDIIPINLPDYTIDAGIVTVAMLIWLQVISVWYLGKNVFVPAIDHFVNSVIPLFTKIVSDKEYPNHCENIGKAMLFENHLAIFHVLHGPPLEYLRYRLEGDDSETINTLRENSTIYSNKLPNSFKLIKESRSRFLKKRIKHAILITLFFVLLIAEKYINSNEFVGFNYFAYAAIVVSLYILFFLVLSAIKYLILYALTLKHKNVEDKISTLNSNLEKFSKFKFPRIINSKGLESDIYLPEKYLFYRGIKRNAKYFNDLLLENIDTNTTINK